MLAWPALVPLAGSLPSRGAWIEMLMVHAADPSNVAVAPLAGSVDRNLLPAKYIAQKKVVAPLAGSVDRNTKMKVSPVSYSDVAPLAGSVDRNCILLQILAKLVFVAPLAGSVDRNVCAV